MTREEAAQLQIGTRVRETRTKLEGTVAHVGQREVEVNHEIDGGGFDFWPIETLEVVPS